VFLRFCAVSAANFYIQEEDAPSEQVSAVLGRIKRGETLFLPSVLLTKTASASVALCIT
jgi:hypothetical protein